MNFLEEKIVQANQAGQIALVPFVTAGFPSTQSFWSIIEELDVHGAHIIEIGVPFTDPVADGPVVEDASRRALDQHVDIDWILNGLQKRQYKAGIVLMGYLNPFLQYGIEAFAKQAQRSGVHACIIPDLPLEESTEIRQTFAKYTIDLIPLVGLNTSLERMQEYAVHAKGYVYVVSVLGTTGGHVALQQKLTETLIRAKKAFNIPIALGFGLHEPQQLDCIPDEHKPHAAVFGSALLKHLDAGRPVKDFMTVWKDAPKGM